MVTILWPPFSVYSASLDVEIINLSPYSGPKNETLIHSQARGEESLTPVTDVGITGTWCDGLVHVGGVTVAHQCSYRQVGRQATFIH